MSDATSINSKAANLFSFPVIMLWLGPLISLLVGFYCSSQGLSSAASVTTAITLLCALWWMTEPIPIPVTSLIPLAVFPLANILTPKQVAEAYGSPLILLLMGGCILSTAMERSGAHKLLALKMVGLFGGSSYRKIVLGFMLASASLSMWISNTATTLMLLPIGIAVLQSCDDKRLTLPLLLGICYAASLGGIGTPIGTPPNLVFMKVYSDTFGQEISFTHWMTIAVPIVIVFLPIVWLWLTRDLKEGGAIELPKASAWTIEQKRVIMVFVFTAIAWMTRKEPFGGWSSLLGFETANDASVVLLAVVIMFIVPSGNEKGGRLLDWETANKIPWGMLLLFAGGMAIAKAFTHSGLADSLASNFEVLKALPVWMMILAICFMVTFLTEMTSNTATTSLLMPVLAVAGASMGIEPALLMVPAAISASFAFMLPVATAPNAIIFGSGRVPIRRMAREGVVLNLLGVVVIGMVCYIRLT